MVAFLLTLLQLARGIRRILQDPESRSLLFLVFGQLALGTLFYRNVERWGFLDSLYFSVVTLATVGYGDLTPTTAAGKIFTMCYIVFGIGLLVAFANKLAGAILAQRQMRIEQHHHDHDHPTDPPGTTGA